MILGRLDPKAGAAAWPRVTASVRLQNSDDFVGLDFLIDTGADMTTIMPADALRLWPDYLTHNWVTDPLATPIGGIGGQVLVTPLATQIAFDEDFGGTTSANRNLSVVQWDPSMLMFPSLLGRDIMSAFHLRIDYGVNPGFVGLELI